MMLFGAVVFISMMCVLIKMFHVSVIDPNATIVVYGIFFDVVVILSMNVDWNVSGIAPYATILVYGIFFGAVVFISMEWM